MSSTDVSQNPAEVLARFAGGLCQAVLGFIFFIISPFHLPSSLLFPSSQYYPL